ncbi:MAG: hypothetical protein WCF03_17165, partial [Nitrososphaeraceae archaeon]
MTNKILGISVLVALVGALAVLALPLYRTLLSNESDIVYAQEQQQTPAADDPMKHFSGADWSLKVNVQGLSPQSASVTIHLYGPAGSGFSDTSTLSYTGNHFALFAVNGNVIHIGDQYQVCVDQNDS